MDTHSSPGYHSPSDPWIRDRKRFRLAMILTGILTLLSIRYPGTHPLYEEAVRPVGMPLSFTLWGSGNLMYMNIIFSGFVLWTLFLIWDSLNRHRIIFCLALIWLLPLAGSTVLAGYQTLVPSGVYAVNIDDEQMSCNYQFANEQMTGTCPIVAANRSGNDLQLQPTVQIPIRMSSDPDMLAIPLKPIELGARGQHHSSANFSVPTPASWDSSASGNGHYTLSSVSGGMTLTLDDGNRARVWGN